jgi:hypothetical protein
MLAQRTKDRSAVGFELRRLADILGRKAAAEIDHRERHAAFGAAAEDRGRRSKSAIPGRDVMLLRADMERDAERHEPALLRPFENVGRKVRVAAEFARQRPFGAGAVAMDAADHARAGSGARDFLDLGLAINREQSDAQPECGGDLALLLDRVAVGDALGAGAGGQHRLGFAHRGHIETGAELGEEPENFRSRIGLRGVINGGVGQRLRECMVVLADHLEVDHRARSFIVARFQEFANPCGHLRCSPSQQSGVDASHFL